METKPIFKKTRKLYDELIQSLEQIDRENAEGIIEGYEKSLMEIDQSLRQLKVLVSTVAFSSIAEEVYFFKEIKPLFAAQFIYYSKILSLEAAKPNAGQYVLKEYYESELKQLKNFVEDYGEFYEYYRRKATYLDEKYFVRNQFDFKMNIDANLYNYDERFTTSHDHLLAKIIANDRLESYLLSSIYKIEGYFFEKFSDKSPLTWTFSKSGLVELLYALHTMHCFNGGNVELSEITRFIEKSFNVELGNVYKTLHEIKNRKTGRTKFLQALEEGLEKRFEEGEE